VTPSVHRWLRPAPLHASLFHPYYSTVVSVSSAYNAANQQKLSLLLSAVKNQIPSGILVLTAQEESSSFQTLLAVLLFQKKKNTRPDFSFFFKFKNLGPSWDKVFGTIPAHRTTTLPADHPQHVNTARPGWCLPRLDVFEPSAASADRRRLPNVNSVSH